MGCRELDIFCVQNTIAWLAKVGGDPELVERIKSFLMKHVVAFSWLQFSVFVFQIACIILTCAFTSEITKDAVYEELLSDPEREKYDRWMKEDFRSPSQQDKWSNTW